MFAKEILYKNYNNVGFGRLELIEIGLRALIADMLYIKAWIGVLTLILFISISTIFICLVRVFFWIFLHIFAASKVMFDITSEYIIVCGEILKRSTFGKKSLLKLVLSLAFCKQFWICIRLVYLRYSITSADHYLWKVIQIVC